MAQIFPRVAFITPLHNAASTITACIFSALTQTYAGAIDVCVYDDGSIDDGFARAYDFRAQMLTKHFSGPRRIILTPCVDGRGHGPAFARNRAIESARKCEDKNGGNEKSLLAYIALLDADDCALPDRIERQLACAVASPTGPESVLVGGRFIRDPPNATASYTTWANTLTERDAELQQWRECTLLQPTWFMSCALYDAVGGFDEEIPYCLRVPRNTALEMNINLKEMTHSHNAGTVHTIATPESSVSTRDASPLTPSWAAICVKPWLTSPPIRITAAELPQHTFQPFPEDTIFFHRVLARGAKLAIVESPVITYTYSNTSLSWRVRRDLLLRVRAALFEERLLQPLRLEEHQEVKTARTEISRPDQAPTEGRSMHSNSDGISREHVDFHNGFLIWGAGRDGKVFFNSLSSTGQTFVRGFLDIDPRKIGSYYPQQQKQRQTQQHKRKRQSIAMETNPCVPTVSLSPCPRCADMQRNALAKSTKEPLPPHISVPIEHFREARGRTLPVVCCVALTAAEKELRENATSVGLEEGRNLMYFT